MDVKTTFLHGDLEEEIFMKQPEGYAVKGKKELVCKLKKSLYGLKQSPRMWYQKFDTYMLGLGFTRSKEDHCVYSKLIGDHLIYFVLYVDDMLLIGNNKEIMLDTPTTLRGGVNECGVLFPKTSLLHKNSSISIQHLFITHCCHL
jgi:hypothetical protein